MVLVFSLILMIYCLNNNAALKHVNVGHKWAGDGKFETRFRLIEQHKKGLSQFKTMTGLI